MKSIRELIAVARQRHARYVFLSGIEFSLRPPLRLLADETVHLPGLTRLQWLVHTDRHYGTALGTVLRVEPPGPVDARFGDALVATVDRFVAQEGNGPALLDYAGELYADEGRSEKSLACFDRAIALGGPSPDVLGHRAAVLAKLGRWDDAAADCARALAGARPMQASVVLLLGKIRARQGNLHEALRLFDLLARSEPAVPEVQLGLGSLRLANADRAGGTAALARAVELRPALAPVRDSALAHAADPAYLVRLVETAR